MMYEMINHYHTDADGKRTVSQITREVPELDPHAQLCALLATKGVIDFKEAADLTGYTEERLTAEVEAMNETSPRWFQFWKKPQ